MIIAVISTFAQFAVSINYSMVDYLPKASPSTIAMDTMEEEFNGAVANTRVMIKDINIPEALAFKKDLEAIEGVSEVTWLDDAIDTKTPIEVADSATVESYYKNGNGLFSFHIEEGKEVKTTDAIYQLIGEKNAMSGEALDTATSQKMTGKETVYATALLVPIIILILILSTRSWAEPVFFLTAIGISVLINLGTNIFIGEISFITQSVAPILQLAVSLDYAIFLLHSFADYRKQTDSPAEAMQMAIKRSFPAIAASASTTFFGFIALAFMDFEIGADLGLNLVKGIVLSFISVMVFLPTLTLMFYHWIDKTEHKQLLPSIRNVGKTLTKFRIPALIILLILIIPSFLGQSKTNFIYGIGEQPEASRAYSDEAAIEKVFGKHTPMVLLLPKGDIAKEESLVQKLKDFSEVKSTISYVDAVSPAIPPEYLEASVTEQFFSDNYSRIIVNTSVDTEGEATFAFIDQIKSLTSDYYNEDYHLLGESVTLYDMKQVVEKDNTVVNLLTVIAIAIVLLITFRSLSFPVVLLVTIQSAVWINLSIPYFTNTPLVYVGYLIISTVQLAATVDYAILLTEAYKENRKEMHALPAIKKTIDEKIFSIGVSASILSSVGFILWLTSSNKIVASIGLLLGRGALLAFIMVVLVLPALLIVLDKVIEKTTWKANFYKGK
ncbi:MULTISPECIES: RND family transporter [unclassified Virgibacillus]|uniref:efflux RND transporter permease subunit n=1 Tax=unclassified Virgibacillus TaxID=2620237 RepID=UPI00090C2173|nr:MULTISPECIES: MMPL family transporter [unclassified Virgibacillus]API91614.1 RND transporter [Virgibacillus sp. 6R]MBS7426864.1 RND family transporter [Virgibacillus sp. 19R1-5]